MQTSVLAEFQLAITKASFDQTTGEKRIRFVGSDTDEDVFGEKMSVQLFDDFIERIEDNEPLGEELQILLRERGWDGGMPYMSISHLKSGTDGKNIPADVVAVYRDGNRLKGKAVMRPTPLGDATYDSIRADRDGTSQWKDKIRISIGFIDYSHAHGGFVFERKSIYDVCPMCNGGNEAGKVYLKGKLVHFALTRRPANERTNLEVEKMAEEITTRAEDAASIVGEDLAKELEMKSTLVEDTPAMVIKSDDEEKPVETAQEEKTEVAEVIAEKAAMSEDAEKEDEEEKSKGKKTEEKTELDLAYEELKSSVASAKTLEEVQGAFNKLGEVVQKSFVKPEPSADVELLKVLSNLTTELRMITADLSELRTEVAVLKAENKPVQRVAEKSVTNVPSPAQIRLTPDMVERGTTTGKQKVYSISELARLTTQM